MYLDIKSDGSLSLEDTDDFDRFEIHSAIDLASGQTSSEFSRISTMADNGRYWIDAESIIALSAKLADLDWCSSFWGMLEKAEPYGFSDLAKKRIKAHVTK